MRLAWVLNLDADEELRDPARYRRTPALARLVRAHARHAHALVGPGDRVVDSASAPLGEEFVGRAWCPTPSALSALRASGVRVPRAPAVEVLQRVNSRRFVHTLGLDLDGACYVTLADDLDARLENCARHATALSHDVWVAKSAFGFAGRGQWRFRLPNLDAEARRKLATMLSNAREMQIEPWVERTGDFGMHGWLDVDGALHRGIPTVQACDARGVWRESRPVRSLELSAEEAFDLTATVERVAEALRSAGYFGPFGVDAYRWRDRSGRVRFHSCSEINARYSMGWSIGMRDFRPPIA